MITENLSTLKIYKLTQEQYERKLANGEIDQAALYFTDDDSEDIDMSMYVTVDQLNNKADAEHIHNDIYYTETEIDEKIDAIVGELSGNIDGKADVHDHPYLSSDTAYAASDVVGGSALYSQKMSITRIEADITTIAADLPRSTEAIYFGGSNAMSYGCPAAYCMINIKKSEADRTIMDCYALNTGDHYINGCMNPSNVDVSPWTGWVQQSNENHTHTTNDIDDWQAEISAYETKLDANDKLLAAKSYADTILSTHISDTVDNVKHITATERTNWNAAYDHSNENHYTFLNIAVDGSTAIVSADSKEDTLTFKGDNNITITPDADNDKITISVADSTLDTKGIVQLTNSTSSTSITTAATPNSVKAAYDLANGKSDIGHSHDDLYYTESEIDSKVSALNNYISTTSNSVKEYADNGDETTLGASKAYTNNAVAQKTQVQIITWGADD